MMADMYYLLSGFSLLFLFIVIVFSEYEYIKVDRVGREYDASIFVTVPLSVINLILFVILAFQSWNVEVYDPLLGGWQSTNMDYMCIVFYTLFLINMALILKVVFEFFIASFYEPKGKWKR